MGSALSGPILMIVLMSEAAAAMRADSDAALHYLTETFNLVIAQTVTVRGLCCERS